MGRSRKPGGSRAHSANLRRTLESLLGASGTTATTTSSLTEKHETQHSLLKTLTSLQPSPKLPHRTLTTLQNLLESHHHDLPFSATLAKHDATLVTNTAIPEGNRIVAIPLSRALRDNLPHELEYLAHHLPLRDDASLRLTLALLYHHYRGEDSPYFEYIQALPDQFDNLLTLAPETVAGLPLVHRRAADVARAQIVRVYAVVHSVLAGLPPSDKGFVKWFSWVHYAWARSVVLSRQNALPGGLGLVPVWDLVNHSPDGVISGIAVESDGSGDDAVSEEKACVVLDSPGLQAGEVVTMRYGARGNAELLLYSGFVIAGNGDDVVELSVPIRDDLRALKARLLRKLGVVVENGADEVRAVVKVKKGGDRGRLLGVARVAVMRKSGVVEVMRQEGLPTAEQDGETDGMAAALVKECVDAGIQERVTLLEAAVDERVRILLDGEIGLLREVAEDVADALECK